MIDEYQMHSKLDNIEKSIAEMQVDVSKNTIDLSHHIRRTDALQEMVEPLYKNWIANKAVSEFKKEQRAELLYKLKLPSYIIAAIVAIGTAITFLMSK